MGIMSQPKRFIKIDNPYNMSKDNLCRDCVKAIINQDSNGVVQIKCGVFGNIDRDIVRCGSYSSIGQYNTLSEQIANGTVIQVCGDHVHLGKGSDAFHHGIFTETYKDGEYIQKSDIGYHKRSRRRNTVIEIETDPVIQ